MGAFELGSQDLGLRGFNRIAAADGEQSGRWHAVKAVGGDATFGAGCAMHKGDAPSSGDVLQQGDTVSGPFTTIDLSAGTVYAYKAD